MAQSVLSWTKVEAGIATKGTKIFWPEAKGFSPQVVVEYAKELMYVGGVWGFTYRTEDGRKLTLNQLQAVA